MDRDRHAMGEDKPVTSVSVINYVGVISGAPKRAFPASRYAIRWRSPGYNFHNVIPRERLLHEMVDRREQDVSPE